MWHRCEVPQNILLWPISSEAGWLSVSLCMFTHHTALLQFFFSFLLNISNLWLCNTSLTLCSYCLSIDFGPYPTAHMFYWLSVWAHYFPLHKHVFDSMVTHAPPLLVNGWFLPPFIYRIMPLHLSYTTPLYRYMVLTTKFIRLSEKNNNNKLVFSPFILFFKFKIENAHKRITHFSPPLFFPVCCIPAGPHWLSRDTLTCESVLYDCRLNGTRLRWKDSLTNPATLSNSWREEWPLMMSSMDTSVNRLWSVQ